MQMIKLTCAAVLIAASANAQDEPARRVATEVAARVPLEQAMKGAPYSAETVIEGSQQLADGNRINRKTTGRVYRDSEGRTRREDDRPNGTAMVSISDPVAGYTYSLDAQNKIAWRTPMGTAGAIMRKVEGAQPAVVTKHEPVRTTAPDGTVTVSDKVTFVETTRAQAEKIQAEQEATTFARAASGGAGRGGGGGIGGALMPTMRGGITGPLEHKVIDGVAVEGRKSTTTIPAGQVGNEQPLTIVSEQWRSPDLNVLVLTRHSDPRTGESSYRLVNIVRAEPDRSMFMVPADYTVKDTGVRRMIEAQRK
jgi:hypothetical protein